jgi:subtilisin family serine protease
VADEALAMVGYPNDVNYGGQWSLPAMGIPEIWNDSVTGTKGDPNVVIAIVDSGVEHTHPDLVDNIWRNPLEIAGNRIDDDRNGLVDDTIGYDYVNTYDPECLEDCSGEDNDPMDGYGHGTWVAGVAAARADNSIGIAGACPNCRLMPLRAGYRTATKGYILHSSAIKSIYYAMYQGADVINLSFGGYDYDALLATAIRDASNFGAVVVAAAGNNGSNEVFYPAGYPGAVSVAAVAEGGSLASFSNYGSWVDTAAPGINISSTGLNGTYTYGYMGTSLATPHVAGFVGLLLSSPAYQRYGRSAGTVDNVTNILKSVGAEVASSGGPAYIPSAKTYYAFSKLYPPHTPTSTATPTRTPTAAYTATPSATPSFTPRALNTATPAPTAAWTATPIHPATFTPVVGVSPTAAPVATRVATPGPTAAVIAEVRWDIALFDDGSDEIKLCKLEDASVGHSLGCADKISLPRKAENAFYFGSENRWLVVPEADGSGLLDHIIIYDAAADTWNEISVAPHAAALRAAAAFNSSIYAGGIGLAELDVPNGGVKKFGSSKRIYVQDMASYRRRLHILEGKRRNRIVVAKPGSGKIVRRIRLGRGYRTLDVLPNGEYALGVVSRAAPQSGLLDIELFSGRGKKLQDLASELMAVAFSHDDRALFISEDAMWLADLDAGLIVPVKCPFNKCGWEKGFFRK